MARRKADDDGTKRERRWAQMSGRTYYAEQLKQLHRDLDGAREAGSWQALAALHRQAMAMREKLDEAELAAKRPAEETMSPEELLAILVDAIRHLPEEDLDEVEAVLLQRRGPSLQLLDGGA